MGLGKKKYKFTLKWLSEVFGRPCEYEFGDESPIRVIDESDNEWCDRVCGTVSCKDCWDKYLMAKMEQGGEKNDD